MTFTRNLSFEFKKGHLHLKMTFDFKKGHFETKMIFGFKIFEPKKTFGVKMIFEVKKDI